MKLNNNRLRINNCVNIWHRPKFLHQSVICSVTAIIIMNLSTNTLIHWVIGLAGGKQESKGESRLSLEE